jgi:hypothetical protein
MDFPKKIAKGFHSLIALLCFRGETSSNLMVSQEGVS